MLEARLQSFQDGIEGIIENHDGVEGLEDILAEHRTMVREKYNKKS